MNVIKCPVVIVIIQGGHLKLNDVLIWVICHWKCKSRLMVVTVLLGLLLLLIIISTMLDIVISYSMVIPCLYKYFICADRFISS